VHGARLRGDVRVKERLGKAIEQSRIADALAELHQLDGLLGDVHGHRDLAPRQAALLADVAQ
jgi:hypothetical protein